jgi:hypothetical protein
MSSSIEAFEKSHLVSAFTKYFPAAWSMTVDETAQYLHKFTVSGQNRSVKCMYSPMRKVVILEGKDVSTPEAFAEQLKPILN